MREIESFARIRGIEPATVLQYAGGYGGTVWDRWKSGGQCSLQMAARIRRYIQDNSSPSLANNNASLAPASSGFLAAHQDGAKITADQGSECEGREKGKESLTSEAVK